MKETFIDKRTLELVLNDQKAEMVAWSGRNFCTRMEESLVDLGSPQAQVVIGVRRSGKSTLCMQSLVAAGVVFAYVDFDDERLAFLSPGQLNGVSRYLVGISE